MLAQVAEVGTREWWMVLREAGWVVGWKKGPGKENASLWNTPWAASKSLCLQKALFGRPPGGSWWRHLICWCWGRNMRRGVTRLLTSKSDFSLVPVCFVLPILALQLLQCVKTFVFKNKHLKNAKSVHKTPVFVLQQYDARGGLRYRNASDPLGCSAERCRTLLHRSCPWRREFERCLRTEKSFSL